MSYFFGFDIAVMIKIIFAHNLTFLQKFSQVTKSVVMKISNAMLLFWVNILGDRHFEGMALNCGRKPAMQATIYQLSDKFI